MVAGIALSRLIPSHLRVLLVLAQHAAPPLEIHFVKTRVVVSASPCTLESRPFYDLIRYGVPCTINYRDKQMPGQIIRSRGHFTRSSLSGILL